MDESTRSSVFIPIFYIFVSLFIIGFANALPIPLSGSTLSIWLAEIGFEKSSIGLFALLGIPLTLKLAWSPLIDFKALPGFKNCPRKGWMLFALSGMALSCLSIGAIDPLSSPLLLALGLWHLSLFTGCLYIVGIAYELESVDEIHYSMGSASVTSGYRVGLLTAGGGALYLASLWSWSVMFLTMGALLGGAACIILALPEPYKSKAALAQKKESLLSYNNLYRGFWNEMIVQPFQLLLKRPDFGLLMIMVLTFKTGDHLSKSMVGPFYHSLGFDKPELALAYKTCGFASCILGAFTAGLYMKNKGSLTSTSIVGCIHACSLICDSFMALQGKSMLALYSSVAIEHFTGGMAMTAFITLLWKVCDKRYAAIQYALLWSLFCLKADLLACVGGLAAEHLSWSAFFLLITLISTSSSLAVAYLIRKKTPPVVLENLCSQGSQL